MDETAFASAFDRIETELHGGMDDDNKSSTRVGAEQTRKGALADAWTVGGTASLDISRYVFSDVQQGSWSPSKPSDYIPAERPQMEGIPGGCKTFYLRTKTLVTLAWNIFWVNDIWDSVPNSESHIALVVDGDPVQEHIRSCGPCAVIDLADDYEFTKLHGFEKNRYWNGSHQLLLEPGWHSVGLHLIADRRVPNTRIWIRSMTALLFPGQP